MGVESENDEDPLLEAATAAICLSCREEIHHGQQTQVGAEWTSNAGTTHVHLNLIILPLLQLITPS